MAAALLLAAIVASGCGSAAPTPTTAPPPTPAPTSAPTLTAVPSAAPSVVSPATPAPTAQPSPTPEPTIGPLAWAKVKSPAGSAADGLVWTPDLGFVLWRTNASKGTTSVFISADGQAWKQLAVPKPGFLSSDYPFDPGFETAIAQVFVLNGRTVLEQALRAGGNAMAEYAEYRSGKWRRLTAMDNRPGLVQAAGDRAFMLGYYVVGDPCMGPCPSDIGGSDGGAWEQVLSTSNAIAVAGAEKVGGRYVITACRLDARNACSLGYVLTSNDGTTWSGKWGGAAAKGAAGPAGLAGSAVWKDRLWIAGLDGIAGHFAGLWSVACAAAACPSGTTAPVEGLTGLAALATAPVLTATPDRLLLAGLDKGGKARLWWSADGAAWAEVPVSGKGDAMLAASADGSAAVLATSAGLWVGGMP
jgi:hypothetical protein